MEAKALSKAQQAPKCQQSAINRAACAKWLSERATAIIVLPLEHLEVGEVVSLTTAPLATHLNSLATVIRSTWLSLFSEGLQCWLLPPVTWTPNQRVAVRGLITALAKHETGRFRCAQCNRYDINICHATLKPDETAPECPNCKLAWGFFCTGFVLNPCFLGHFLGLRKNGRCSSC